MLKKILIISCAVFLFAAMAGRSYAAWFIYHKPAFKGKVIDSETKEPIEGAVVVATYTKHPIVSGPAGGSESIIEIKEALTDKNGEFSIPSYTTVINPFFYENWVRFIIFKPGYGSLPDYHVSPPSPGVNLEEFFSREATGTEGEIEWKGMGKRFKVFFGVVELPRLKTSEERRKSLPSLPSPDRLLEKQTNLIRLINEEEENLGLQKSDPYKAREFIRKMGK